MRVRSRCRPRTPAGSCCRAATWPAGGGRRAPGSTPARAARRQLGQALAGPHVDPDEAAALASRVGANRDLVFEGALGRLARHVDAAAIGVVLPAMVDAAQ